MPCLRTAKNCSTLCLRKRLSWPSQRDSAIWIARVDATRICVDTLTNSSCSQRQTIPCSNPVVRRPGRCGESSREKHRAQYALATDDLVGVYRIVRRLGIGGMASVYLAERADGQLEQQVALKILDREDTEDSLLRFNQERQILASLDHPNIARSIDAGLAADGRPYVTMEFIDGEPIDAYCDRYTGLRFASASCCSIRLSRPCKRRTETSSSTVTSKRPMCWSPLMVSRNSSTSVSRSC